MKIKATIEYEVDIYFHPKTDEELRKGHYTIVRNMGTGDCGAERMYHEATNTPFPCGIGLKICFICGKHPIHDLDRCMYCYKDFLNSIPG